MKRVLFRVDASHAIGLGHLMRCLALAQHLAESDVAVTFAMLSSSRIFCQNRADWVGDIIIVPDIDDATFLKNQIDKQRYDWVVLDGYQFTSSYRKLLSETTAQLAVFDDKNDSGELYADLVINGANSANYAGYSISASGATLCLGEKFRVLRTEFAKAPLNTWDDRDQLIISFGGSDPLGLTIPLLEELDIICQKQKLKTPLHVNVLTGSAYSDLGRLESVLTHLNINVTHTHDSLAIASVFRQGRLAVSAAGGTQFELLACDTPAILVVVADNQKLATKDAENQGWCHVLDYHEMTLRKLVEHTLAFWNNSALLKKMHQSARCHKNVAGAQRVIDTMRGCASV